MAMPTSATKEIDHLCRLANSDTVYEAVSRRGECEAATRLIWMATAESPAVYAYGELLECRAMQALKGTRGGETALRMLEQFAFGTLRSYREAQMASKVGDDTLPGLVPEQEKKLRQLTVLSLARDEKVIAYDVLLRDLELASVRELEDFLINECLYTGIVRGKLDQKRKCLEVRGALARDIQPQHLDQMIDIWGQWLETSDALMNSIEEKVASASSQATAQAQRKEIAEAKADEMKNKMKAAVDMEKAVLSGGLFDVAPEDRERGTGSGRGKRRR